METMSIEQFIAKYTCPAPPPSPFDDPNYGSFEQPTSPSFSASAAPSMFSQSPMARPGMPANYGAEMTLVPANQSMHGGAAPFQAGGGSGPVTQIRLVSKDPQFFPTLIRDLNKSVKVGRLMEPSNETDPTFIPYNTKVVSRVHAEIWEANGAPLSLSPSSFLLLSRSFWAALFTRNSSCACRGGVHPRRPEQEWHLPQYPEAESLWPGLEAIQGKPVELCLKKKKLKS